LDPIGSRQSAIKNILAGMTRLELANQLIENQSAFHFAFIPRALLIVDCGFLIVDLIWGLDV
jgi:hypothetical protein